MSVAEEFLAHAQMVARTVRSLVHSERVAARRWNQSWTADRSALMSVLRDKSDSGTPFRSGRSHRGNSVKCVDLEARRIRDRLITTGSQCLFAILTLARPVNSLCQLRTGVEGRGLIAADLVLSDCVANHSGSPAPVAAGSRVTVRLAAWSAACCWEAARVMPHACVGHDDGQSCFLQLSRVELAHDGAHLNSRSR